MEKVYLQALFCDIILSSILWIQYSSSFFFFFFSSKPLIQARIQHLKAMQTRTEQDDNNLHPNEKKI